MPDRRHLSHRAFISSLCCSACGAQPPSDCAHVSMREFGGVLIPYSEQKFKGKEGKAHDKWTVPLCRHCHTDQHQFGERSFWKVQEINPLALAQSLWRNTGNLEACRGIVGRARMGVGL